MKPIAIVTGGSRGIGLGIVKQLLKEDYYVVVASRGPLSETGEKEFEEMLKTEPDLTYITCDIGITSDRESLLKLVEEKHGRVDLLVNNAGVAPKVRTDLLEETEESWDYVFDTNLRGTMFLSQEVAKIMQKQDVKNGMRGMIINFGSLSSYASSSNRVAYCASKAGVSMLTKVYAERLAGDQIYVYEIRPGVIETAMTRVVKDKYDKKIAEGEFPIARWGQPSDIAMAVSCLCEGKLLYTTGQVIDVDGGFHIRKL